MPNYEVTFTALCVVTVIDAKDERDAFDLARTDITFGDFKEEEAKIETLCGKKEVEISRRHADYVSEPPGEKP